MSATETLMELVNDCGPAAMPAEAKDAAAAQVFAAGLAKAGFVSAAKTVSVKARSKVQLAAIAYHKYPVITPAKIKEFLERKAEAYNRGRSSVAKYAARLAEEYGIVGLGQGEARRRDIADAFMDNVALNSTNTWWSSSAPMQVPSGDPFVALTLDASSSDPGTIGRFVWNEVYVEGYKGIPPADVVRALEEQKGREIFDSFTVATVESIRDPLLLGRINGSDDRYYIAQWGEDVSLDDVI